MADRTCVSCGVKTSRPARGMCGKCWQRMRSAGRLDEFPKRPHRGGTRRLPGDVAAWLASMAGTDGCWLWPGRPNPTNGYGRVSVGPRKRRLAHVVAFEVVNGPVPSGFDVDHQCHNQDPTCPGGPGCWHRLCVRPDHLEAVTRKVNLNRGRDPGPNRAKTHCPQGHPYDLANTYVIPSTGGRMCRICKATRDRGRYGA